ncbi:hypothetical protein LTR95_014128 [Oleoguttula sp. CCFEE 5521]
MFLRLGHRTRPSSIGSSTAPQTATNIRYMARTKNIAPGAPSQGTPAMDSLGWTTVTSNRTHLLTANASLAGARNPSVAQRSRTIAPSVLATQMGALNMNSQAPANTGPGGRLPAYNASNALPASAMTNGGKNSVVVTNSVASGRSVRRKIVNANLTIHKNPDFGAIYTKRRMFVVLYVWGNKELHCLPLNSFSNRGIMAKDPTERHEYVCVKNENDMNFNTQGPHKALEASMKRTVLDNTTTLYLTGGIRVAYNEDVNFCGRLTKDSYHRMRNLWDDLVKVAKTEPFR